MKGSIVADEQIFPIVDIYLDGGRIWFIGQVEGAVRGVDTVGFKIFDRSGALVYTSKTPLRFGAVAPWSVTTFTVGMDIEWVKGRQMTWSG